MRNNTQVPQPSGFTEHVADEAVYKELDDKLVRATTTDSSLEAEHDSGAKKLWGIPLLKLGLRMCLNFLMIHCSQEGRKIHDIDANEDITLVNDQDDAEMFDVNNLQGEEKLKDLKNKSFDSIQKMFDRSFNRVNIFVDFRTELVKDSSKRAGEELTQGISKKQKVNDDKEIAELKELKEIILNKEEVAIDAIPLAVKSSKIKMFDRSFNRVNTFVDFRTELVKDSSKRVREELTQGISKKQKVNDDKETAELKELKEIILNREEVAIDAIPLAVKSSKIVDWKIHKEENKSYY
nr:hypothetical protein [Tanacetum cinerariifolium]